MLYANIEIAGRPRFEKGTGGMLAWRRISPDYFRVLGIPTIRGRTFREDDRSPTQQVVIISDSLAHRLFPNEDAIGKQMRWGFQGPFRTIVGVAANVKNNPELSGADDPEYYVPRKLDDTEGVSRQASVMVRTSLDAAAVSDAIRNAVAEIDPTLPVVVQTMGERVTALADRPRFNAVLLGVFAFIGILLSAIGIYGVISFLVAQRTQEIGIRMALGATPASIIRHVLSGAMRWTVGGIVIGLFGSVFAGRLLRTLLFQVPEWDAWSLSFTVAVLFAVSLLAAWLPCRRASRTDPLIALRQD
jgi:predicted permease